MPIQKITSGVIESSQTLTTPTISGNLSLDSTGTTGVRVPSANTLSFYEGGVEAVRIDSSGNMGIGASSISNRLEVVQSASADASAAVRAGTNGYAASLKLIANDATGSRYNTLNSFYGSTEQWSIRSGAADSTMTFCTGSSATERMRLDASGNLFVGGTTQNGATGVIYSKTTAKVWIQIASGRTIAGSFNVSSVTDNGVADFVINYSTAFADGNYAAVGGVSDNSNYNLMFLRTPTTTNITVAMRITSGGSNFSNAYVAIFA